MKHYHVLGGMHGCMPNYNSTHTGRDDAQDNFKYMVEREFDDFDLSDNDVHYSQELDYAEVKNGGNEYYEITKCDYPDCLLDIVELNI